MKRVPIVTLAPLVGDRVSQFEGARPYVATGDAGDDGTFGSVLVTYEERPSRADVEVRSGDVSLARMKGTSKVIAFEGSGPFPILSTGFAVFRPDIGQLDQHFLKHWLRSEQLQREKDMQCSGAIQPAITNQRLAALEIPLPSISEQKRIASILDAADALRTKRRQALEKLDALDLSLAKAMFDQYPGTKELGDHITFLTSGARGWAKHYADSGARFIRSIDVRMNSISDHDAVFVDAPSSAESRRIMVKRGDVLLTITGSRIGRAAEVRPDLAGSYISQHVAIIRVDPSALVPGYLSLWLCHPSFGQLQIASKQYGQTKPGLNFEQIRSFRLPVPPLDAQQQLLDEVSQVSRIRSAEKIGDTRLDSLFKSLQLRAFRGEL